KEVDKILNSSGIAFAEIGKPIDERRLDIKRKKEQFSFSINEMRDIWYETSYLLDCKQSGEKCARERFENYKKQPLKFNFNYSPQITQINTNNISENECNLWQNGKIISENQRTKNRPIAAIIREKGTNGEREMAYSLYLAGFEVKDVTMTDLATGRETLENVNFIIFCGGFSNSDVLGSAKGWAGVFLYNEKAKTALENFYRRPDTLSLGICNGCQLMVELANSPQNPPIGGLGVVQTDNAVPFLPLWEKLGGGFMLHNDSHKFESEFISVEIPQNNSVMFCSLSGSKLGIWVAHGEGKFHLPQPETDYNIVAKYTYEGYPANPNGSDYNTAGICSADGRHLAMMPHLERAIFPWQWAHYPADRKKIDKVTAWVEAFENARKWIEKKLS
ncbi:MAG: phosphoribosylformylglycinamidine synthase subunit PurQ, partial [Prevotellaceae bacterium]|nr:phosphoribosylformylglycinamidine synthase subunit PurQ [Prevotellaceae bacterium]